MLPPPSSAGASEPAIDSPAPEAEAATPADQAPLPTPTYGWGASAMDQLALTAQLALILPEPILLLDGTAQICEANPEVCARLRKTRADLIGQPAARFIAPASRASFASMLAQALTQPGTPLSGEIVLDDQAGNVVPLHCSVVALPHSSEPLIAVTGRSAHEVAELTRALAAANQQLAESYHSLERSNRLLAHERSYLTRLNQLARRLSQSLDLPQVLDDALTGAIELLGADFGWLIVLDTGADGPIILASHTHVPANASAIEAALHGETLGGVLRAGQVWRLSDSSIAPDIAALFQGQSLLLAPLLTKIGTVGLLALAQRNTNAFRAEQELAIGAVAETVALAVHNAQLYTRLRDADAARERMTNLLVHDIRSPLMATHASIEIMRRAVAELAVHPFVHESLASGLRSVRTVIDLTNDLLDVKRLQSDAPTLNYRHIILANLFEEVRQQMQTLALERAVTVVTQAEPPTLELQADLRLLRRVLVNLLANAVRFTPEGSQIELHAVINEPGHVLILADDRGPGVLPADRERIFLPFVQAAGEAHRGTGLGLAFCREVAHAHGGRIWVEDRPGGGSRFCLLLPLKPH